ncbi:MAG TPA: M20/M25/M40 family metallo-hydrolase [Acidobacteriaceae bacterium]|jgi:acetylornithine deacetylase/succinyl-diaminopimelate desuccinylase-like protein
MQSFLSLNPLGQVPQLAAQRRVHQAFRWLHLHDGLLMEWQRTLVGIPAPPFGEAPRAEWLLEQFRSLGLAETGIDAEGNVLGLLPASSATKTELVNSPQRVVVLSAHIDTVFPAGTEVDPQIQGTRLTAPGACDNAAGITGLLAITAALIDASIHLPCPVLFAANVGEEGEGDLRGMRYLYQRSEWRDRIAAHIVLDGAGHEVAVTEALGSRRFLATVTGPGGHSWTDAGSPNPIAILSHAIAALTTTEASRETRTTLNVGTIEGGSSVNAIPEQASARFDLRSTSSEELVCLEVELHRAVEDAVLAANAGAAEVRKRRLNAQAAFTIERIGDRPAGRLTTAANGPTLYDDLLAVDRHLGIRTEPRIASTDANIPLSLGIAAVSIGAGGDGGGIHTRNEWYDATHRELALKRILLLLMLTAERC